MYVTNYVMNIGNWWDDTGSDRPKYWWVGGMMILVAIDRSIGQMMILAAIDRSIGGLEG
jgi:hypothetical protein